MHFGSDATPRVQMYVSHFAEVTRRISKCPPTNALSHQCRIIYQAWWLTYCLPPPTSRPTTATSLCNHEFLISSGTSAHTAPGALSAGRHRQGGGESQSKVNSMQTFLYFAQFRRLYRSSPDEDGISKAAFLTWRLLFMTRALHFHGLRRVWIIHMCSLRYLEGI